jgi:3-dehydroquinate synthase
MIASVARLEQEIAVHFRYPIYFTADLFAPENESLIEALCAREPGRRHRVFAIVERAVAKAFPDLLQRIEAYVAHHSNRLELASKPLVLEGGEQCKNDPAFIDHLQAELSARRVDRHSFVAAVGGGAFQDAVGFAAAICHRGVRKVRIPTTVLSQADSGVGVKNGINFLGKKNFLGAFAPPFAVLNDSRFLATLERRDRIAGMAEGLKVALVRDPELFRWIRNNAPALEQGAADRLELLIRRTAELHLNHIATGGDPFETGSARPLDFGHWAAHKLEALSEHRLRHGEAVAIGIALDTWYSAHVGLLEPEALAEVISTLEALGFELWDDTLALKDSAGRRHVLEGLAEFREHLGGELTVTLLRRLGQGLEVHTMHEEIVEKGIEWLERRRLG